jgi:hypothetical protein
MNLADIYRVFHLEASQYTFFSAECGAFSKTAYVLGHKVSLNKYKKIKIFPYVLSDHNGIILETNSKRNCRKYTNAWRLNKSLSNDQWVIEEIREKITKIHRIYENENTIYWNLWDTGKAVLRVKFITMSTYILKKPSEISNK